MMELLSNLLKRLCKVFAMFLLILAVLMIGEWVRANGQYVLEEANKINSSITEKNDNLKKVNEYIAKHQSDWDRARQKVADIIKQAEDLKKIYSGEVSHYNELQREANSEKAVMDDKKKACGRWLKVWEDAGMIHRRCFLPHHKERINAYHKAKKDYYIAKGKADIAKKVVEERKIEIAKAEAKSQSEMLIDEKNKLETKDRLESEIDELNADITGANRSPLEKLCIGVLRNFSPALIVLVGVLLMPVAIKAFLFFGIAPIADRFPAIQLFTDEEVSPLSEPQSSSVSVELNIVEDEEVIVHSDFLQSADRAAKKRTQWLLNSRIPISSIASGMYMLTCIRPEKGATTSIIVSAQKDALDELGVVEVPYGHKMVIHPRSLAGLVKKQHERVHISRHWRLGNLHAWLTLQLRSLVFHGPCRLVLKGCRGIKAERPNCNRPRMINQSATIGFSANLKQSSVRCETFVSYLRGKENLFNDQFEGDQGIFLYEEMPNTKRKGGITGRGLEGFLDAVLKVFGV